MATSPTTYEVRSLPPGTPGTLITLREIARFVRRDVRDAGLRRLAEQIVANIRGHDFSEEIKRVFEYVRDRIIYRRDPVATERVQDARRTLQSGVGDCDDKVTLLATLLGLLGHRTRLVVLSHNGCGFNHVYLEVLYKNQWLALDPTNEFASVGWEPRGKLRQSFPIWPGSNGIGNLGPSAYPHAIDFQTGSPYNAEDFAAGGGGGMVVFTQSQKEAEQIANQAYKDKLREAGVDVKAWKKAKKEAAAKGAPAPEPVAFLARPTSPGVIETPIVPTPAEDARKSATPAASKAGAQASFTMLLAAGVVFLVLTRG